MMVATLASNCATARVVFSCNEQEEGIPGELVVTTSQRSSGTTVADDIVSGASIPASTSEAGMMYSKDTHDSGTLHSCWFREGIALLLETRGFCSFADGALDYLNLHGAPSWRFAS